MIICVYQCDLINSIIKASLHFLGPLIIRKCMKFLNLPQLSFYTCANCFKITEIDVYKIVEGSSTGNKSLISLKSKLISSNNLFYILFTDYLPEICQLSGSNKTEWETKSNIDKKNNNNNNIV